MPLNLVLRWFQEHRAFVAGLIGTEMGKEGLRSTSYWAVPAAETHHLWIFCIFTRPGNSALCMPVHFMAGRNQWEWCAALHTVLHLFGPRYFFSLLCCSIRSYRMDFRSKFRHILWQQHFRFLVDRFSIKAGAARKQSLYKRIWYTTRQITIHKNCKTGVDWQPNREHRLLSSHFKSHWFQVNISLLKYWPKFKQVLKFNSAEPIALLQGKYGLIFCKSKYPQTQQHSDFWYYFIWQAFTMFHSYT